MYICCNLWVLKRTISVRGYFEHAKHMFKLMGKKISTLVSEFYTCTFGLSGTMIINELLEHAHEILVNTCSAYMH